LDRVDPKAKEASESFFCGTEANIGLHERNIAREVEDGAARKMVGLEFVKVKELTKEIGGRKAKAALKMRNKNDELSGFGLGFHLITWNPARYLRRYPSGTVQPVDIFLGHVGALPSSPSDVAQVHAGILAGTASFLALLGARIRNG
jgi:hypothetical protein